MNRKKWIGIGGIILAAILALLAIFVIAPAVRYNNAEQALKDGRFEESIRGFSDLKEYRDAPERVKEATYAYAEDRQQAGNAAAADLFASVSGYLDSDSRAVQARAEQLFDQGETAAAADLYRELGAEYQSREDGFGALYAEAEQQFGEERFEEAVASFVKLGVYGDAKDRIPEVTYARAESLRLNGDTAEAEEIFLGLGEYQDSAVKAVQAKADGLFLEERYAEAYDVYITLDENYQTHAEDYQQLYDNAVQKLETGLYDEAIAGFEALGSYSDVELRIKETKYRKAESLRLSGETAEAEEIFLGLGEYQDSAVKAVQAKADGLYNAGDYAGAHEIYATLEENYQTNAAGYAEKYGQAKALAEAGSYDESVEIFSALGGYEDASEKVSEVTYDKAEALAKAGSYDASAEVFRSLNGYADAAEKVSEVTYAKAESLRISGRTAEAEEIFLGLGEYQDSAAKAVQAKADGLFLEDRYAEAYDVYITLDENYQTHAEDYQELYDSAVQKLETGLYDEAVSGFEALGSYSDVELRIKETKYRKAESLRLSGETAEAEETFLRLGEYQDSGVKAVQAKADGLYNAGDYAGAHEIYATLEENYQTNAAGYAEKYGQAKALAEAGSYDESVEIFSALGGYEDALEKVPEVTYAKAESLRVSGKTAEAEEIFLGLGEYQDSAVKAVQAKADGLFLEERYAEAYDVYITLDENYQTHAEDYQQLYDSAVQKLEAGLYDEAVSGFEALGSYSDVELRIKETEYRKAEGLRLSGETAEAEEIFLGLGEYQDSVIKAVQTKADGLFLENRYDEARELYDGLDGNYQTHAEEYRQWDEEAEAQRREEELAAKRREEELAARYQEAEQLLAEDRFDEAAEAFEALGTYSDAEKRITEVTYEKAEALAEAGSYDEAVEIFTSLGDYEDAEEKISEVTYDKAEALAAAGSYDEAVKVFTSLGDYEDAEKKISEVTYDKAKALAEAGSYDEAVEVFTSLGDYEDAEKKISEVTYDKAETLAEAGSYDEAVEVFTSLGDYEDAEKKISEVTYDKAETLAEAGSYDEAVEIFMSLGNYEDAEKKISEVTYDKAEALAEAGSDDEAIEIFTSLGDYEDAGTKAAELIYDKAETLRTGGETAEAEQLFMGLGEFADSADKAAQSRADGLYAAGSLAEAQDIYGLLDESLQTHADEYAARYEDAGRLAEDGSYDAAVEAYSSLGNYKDALEKIPEVTYNKAEALAETGAYDEAVEVFTALGDYEDAKDKISETLYAKAVDLRDQGQEMDAVAVLTELGDWGEARQTIAGIGHDYLVSGDLDAATEVCAKVGDLPESRADLLTAADSYIENASYAKAIGAYNAINDNGEAAEKRDALQQEIYACADTAFAERRFDEAESLFAELTDYEDSAERATASARKGELDAKYSVGATAVFGHYEQDNDTENGTEPIEWIVLKRDGDKALLMTRYAMDTMPYFEGYKSFCTWGTSTVRAWLNGEFTNTAFTDSEKACLLETEIHDNRIVFHGKKYPAGDPTSDRIFLLSKSELIRYASKYRKAQATPYAVARGAWVSPNGNSYYWLRSQTINDDSYGLYVTSVGETNWYYACSRSRCVRPAAWVDLDAEGSGF